MPRVLITRSPHQASELAARLRALDLEPVLIPAIEFGDPSTFVPLDKALAQLVSARGGAAFDWLLFTSANAVGAFQRRVQAREPGEDGAKESFPRQGKDGRTFRIAAIGPATARSLEAIGLQPDLVPPTAVAESLTAALLPHAHRPDGSSAHFLLIRAEAARDYLPETLRAAGAQVTIVPAYRTVIPAGSVAEIQSLFATRAAWPDAITFTSSSTVSNLLALFEAAGISLPPDILRVSIGPVTSQTLRECGLAPHAEAANATVAALAEAVAAALARRI